jgi:hypothetical protein
LHPTWKKSILNSCWNKWKGHVFKIRRTWMKWKYHVSRHIPSLMSPFWYISRSWRSCCPRQFLLRYW